MVLQDHLYPVTERSPLSAREIGLVFVGIVLCFALQVALNRVEAPDMYDSRQFLGAGYNLANHGTFNQSPSIETPAPSTGREPAYGALLALMFLADPNFDLITPACLRGPGCDPAAYRNAVAVQYGLIAATGLVVFLVVRRLTGSPLAALLSG